MNAQIKGNQAPAPRGWVFYDGQCPLCTASIRRFGPALRRRGFEPVPQQTSWVRQKLGMAEDEAPREIIVLTAEEQRVGGAPAVLFLARQIWWTWPLWLLGQLPGALRLMRRIYGWIARHRYCLSGACGLDSRRG